METCAKEGDQELPTLPTDSCVAGSIVEFDDGSLWKIAEPLSKRCYQQANPPFEARQVFACVCVGDPAGKYNGVKEAVLKIKFQVTGPPQIIKHYEDYLEECLEEVETNSYISDDDAAWGIQHARDLLHAATHPVQEPNEATTQEIEALDYFGEKECAHTPHLLTYKRGILKDGTDAEEMTGGFAVFILMTKLPGRSLKAKEYFDFSPSKRAEMKETFKKVLIDIWKLRVYPGDSALRNIVWEEGEQKCYIVDFEDYCVLPKDKNMDDVFTDDYFEFWGLEPRHGIQHCWY